MLQIIPVRAEDDFFELRQFLLQKRNFYKKRAVYQNYNGQDNYFFLNYEKDDSLKEVEVQSGLQIIVDNIKVSFDTEISEISLKLKSISSDIKQLSL